MLVKHSCIKQDAKNIKAIILDLDDTLYDCSGTLVLRGRKHVAKVIARLINCSEEEAYHLQLEMEKKIWNKCEYLRKNCVSAPPST